MLYLVQVMYLFMQLKKQQNLVQKLLHAVIQMVIFMIKMELTLIQLNELKEVERKRIREYVDEHPEAEYYEGCKVFGQFLVISLFHVQHKMKLMKNQQKFLLQMV